MTKPVALIILDGFGLRDTVEGNAVAQANKPNYDKYWNNYPHTTLEASGEAVGLPDGQMIHPVAACATAAVSLEEGVDKIRVGKADFVVTGGIDDISVESLTGFGDMNATAESAALAAKGINERFYSRANDRRRGGFVEAEGGGTVLLARGDVAARLGLPVYAVVAHAQSYADGIHTSIPAPGLGALAAGRGGKNSVLDDRVRSNRQARLHRTEIMLAMIRHNIRCGNKKRHV